MRFYDKGFDQDDRSGQIAEINKLCDKAHSLLAESKTQSVLDLENTEQCTIEELLHAAEVLKERINDS